MVQTFFERSSDDNLKDLNHCAYKINLICDILHFYWYNCVVYNINRKLRENYKATWRIGYRILRRYKEWRRQREFCEIKCCNNINR